MDKNYIKNIFIWIIGIFLILVGIFGISADSFFGPILLTISGFLVLPPSFTLIKSFSKDKINKNLRVILIILFFSFGIKLYPTNTDNTVESVIEEKQNIATVKSATIVNTNINEDTDNEKGTVISVTDGDTVRIMLNGINVPVRLIGIDTPEINHQSEPIQCYGPEAKKALEYLILNKEVDLEKDTSDKDKYDRYLRYIWIGEIMVNEYITQNGYGFSSEYPPDTKYQNRILAGEQNAKSTLKGLWSKDTCKGDVYTGTYKDPNFVPNIPTSETKPITNVVAPVIPVVPVVPPSNENSESSNYTCNCKKVCGQMSSCAEAQYQLNVCGCSARDGDKDGIACDSDCQ